MTGAAAIPLSAKSARADLAWVEAQTLIRRRVARLLEALEAAGIEHDACEAEGRVTITIGLVALPKASEVAAPVPEAVAVAVEPCAVPVEHLAPEPEPEPAPKPSLEPAPAPKSVKPREKHNAPAANGAPWTVEEIERALAMIADGMTYQQVADALGRTKASLNLKLSKWRAGKVALGRKEASAAEPADMASEAPLADPAPSAKATVSPGPLPPRAAPRPVATPRLPRSGSWTAERDVILLDGLSHGEGAAEVAAQLGVGRDEVVARYRALVPDASWAAQTAALKRARAEMAETAE
ncbi:hypothetical protein [Jannaschia formosa]|uniref:hypothetical protein n=1 Tax=Jannaschia formosa TaxID=2259592 RepID=UPI0010758059|nr:hypothetical protein [Jannaschia formosa]TFL16416.1 hypothetical protein DR046_20040 [Jannaschia formosa]